MVEKGEQVHCLVEKLAFMVRSPADCCAVFLVLLFLWAAPFFFFWLPFFLPGWTCLPSGDVSVAPPAAPSSSGSLAAAAAASAAAFRSCSSSSFLRVSSSLWENGEMSSVKTVTMCIQSDNNFYSVSRFGVSLVWGHYFHFFPGRNGNNELRRVSVSVLITN